MKKANELRLGNWVLWETEYALINGIYAVEVFFKCGDSSLINNISGIPLTPEILEKAGFIKCSCGGYKTPELHLYIDKDGFMFDKKYRIGIKYLHQLQNLIFALTGEELTVNL